MIQSGGLKTYPSYQDLLPHIGHELTLSVSGGGSEKQAVIVECADCGEQLFEVIKYGYSYTSRSTEEQQQPPVGRVSPPIGDLPKPPAGPLPPITPAPYPAGGPTDVALKPENDFWADIYGMFGGTLGIMGIILWLTGNKVVGSTALVIAGIILYDLWVGQR